MLMRSRCLAIVGVAATMSVAFAGGGKDATTNTAPAAGQPQLPPGWTEADMQACMQAATPGPMQQKLVEGVGVWNGKCTMWMGPGAPAQTSDCVATISTVMDGRYTKCEWTGDMPGMGPFTGYGLYAFDNASQQFQSTWIDNWSTGIMYGKGELSSDGKTMTWAFTFTCPLTNKPTTMREIDRITGKDTRAMEMYGVDPKSGKEYKMMAVELTRKPGTGPVSAAH